MVTNYIGSQKELEALEGGGDTEKEPERRKGKPRAVLAQAEERVGAEGRDPQGPVLPAPHGPARASSRGWRCPGHAFPDQRGSQKLLPGAGQLRDPQPQAPAFRNPCFSK